MAFACTDRAKREANCTPNRERFAFDDHHALGGWFSPSASGDPDEMSGITPRALALLFVGTADASGRRIECPPPQSSTGTTIACDDCVYSRCGCESLNSSSCCTQSYSCTQPPSPPYPDDDDAKGFVLGSILRQVWFIFIVMGIISTIIWRRPHAIAPFPPPLPQLASLLYSARGLISHHTTASGVGRRLRQRRMLLAAQQAPTARVSQPPYPSFTTPSPSPIPGPDPSPCSSQAAGTNYANVSPAANGYPAAFGQPIQGQPVAGVADTCAPGPPYCT